jgi:ABC-type lipoprotein export system ATPase subunit
VRRLLRPSAGTIRFERPGPDDEAALDRFRATEVGIVLQGGPQRAALCKRRNVDFAQRGARQHGREVPDASEVLDLVGILPLANAPLATLTPGQLQLAALAVGIAAYPGVLLADEPTSQLDHAARDTVLAAIREVNAQVGTTVLIVTHDPQVAAALPRTVTIRDGRVGGEGRSGQEYAVVSADGSLPLPPDALDRLPQAPRARPSGV